LNQVLIAYPKEIDVASLLGGKPSTVEPQIPRDDQLDDKIQLLLLREIEIRFVGPDHLLRQALNKVVAKTDYAIEEVATLKYYANAKLFDELPRRVGVSAVLMQTEEINVCVVQ
jgi:hypothetical protein